MSVICVRMDWDRTAIPLPTLPGRWHTVHYGPEPGHPGGCRGLAMSSAWDQYSAGTGAAGLLLLDGDVVIDPLDLKNMLAYIHGEPQLVWTAPMLLWPASTTRKDWVWGHWPGGPHDASQDFHYDAISWCGLGFTYLPRRLIEDCQREGLGTWRFPHVDTRICERSQFLGVEIAVARQCHPKHVNY